MFRCCLVVLLEVLELSNEIHVSELVRRVVHDAHQVKLESGLRAVVHLNLQRQ